MGDFAFWFVILFIVSLLTFWFVGSSFCRCGRILSAAMILSAVCALLLIPELSPVFVLAAFVWILTAPYLLTRRLLHLPRSRAYIAAVIFFLFILLLSTISYFA